MNVVPSADSNSPGPVICAAPPDSVRGVAAEWKTEHPRTSLVLLEVFDSHWRVLIASANISRLPSLAMGATMPRDAMQLAAFGVVLLLLAFARIECIQAKPTTPEVTRIELMQYNHESSPYATPNLSLRDRVRIAVETSRGRAEWFNWKINSKNCKYSSKATVPVNTNQGDYLMKISLGTPPQNKIAIADTGSDLFWVECNCISCFSEPDAAFSPSSSSTFSPVSCSDKLCSDLPTSGCTSPGNQCEYKYTYGDQSSTEGILSSDVVELGSLSSTVDFGCGEKNQGSFVNSDGLVGLGRGPVSIISQIGISVFSYCLTSFYSSTSQTSSLVLGKAGGSYRYTPLTFNSANPTFYYVTLNGILVNGSPLIIPPGTFSTDITGNGGFILDSGTTITQLQMAAYAPLLVAVRLLVTYPKADGSSIGLDACYHPGTSSPSWPSVTFQFESVDVVLPGDNLFLRIDNNGNYCMAIQASSFGFGIFGNVQQQNFNIEYDVGNNRLGFSGPTSC